MHAGKLLLATASYFVITMAWAYPWHVVWFHEQYVAWGAMTRPEPIIPLGMAAVITQGIVLAYLYPYCYRGGPPLWEGVRFSLIAGLLVYTVMGFATAAKFKIEPIPTFLAYHTVFQLVQFTLTGAALGLIYGRVQQQRAPIAD